MTREARREPATLEEVAALVRACRLCGLCEGRANAVPGEGAEDARLMLVGEAPGRHEDESGRPFVGSAGRNLDLALSAAGILREAIFVTSIVKCRPPGNRDPTEAEKDACRPHLQDQLRVLRPRVIVALGRHGLHGLLGHMPPGFAALPGSFLEGPQGTPIWVSLHPAAIIYRPRWRGKYLAQWEAFGAWFRSGRPAPVGEAIEVPEERILAHTPAPRAAAAVKPRRKATAPAARTRKAAAASPAAAKRAVQSPAPPEPSRRPSGALRRKGGAGGP